MDGKGLHLAVAGLHRGGFFRRIPAVDEVAAAVAAMEGDGAAGRGPVSSGGGGDAHGEHLGLVAAVFG